MTKEGQWNYLRWDGRQKRLIPDDKKAPLSHENAVRTITELQGHMTGDIIYRFQSTQALRRLEEEGHNQATFNMTLSLRHPQANEVHSGFQTTLQSMRSPV